MTRQEAYKILEINQNATVEEIKKAYKKQAKKYHPDIYPGDKKIAEEKMKQINEAYTTLLMPYSSNYVSDDEYWASVAEELRKLRKEIEEMEREWKECNERIKKKIGENNKRLRQQFFPIFILILISISVCFIGLFTILVKNIVYYFSITSWFFFGMCIVWIIMLILFSFICIFSFITMWKKMFK